MLRVPIHGSLQWMRPTRFSTRKFTNVVDSRKGNKCLAQIRDPGPQALRSPLVAEEVIFFLFQVSESHNNGTTMGPMLVVPLHP